MPEIETRRLHYAGLALPGLTALTAAIPRTLGDHWRIEPWMGRMSGDLLVVGEGPLAEQARLAGCAALQPVVHVAAESVAEFSRGFHAQLPAYAHYSPPQLRPFHAARSLGGLAPLLLCGALDAKSRAERHHYQHPQAGAVLIDFRAGWISTEQPLANVIAVLLEHSWKPAAASTELGHRHSIESAIWLTVLRWRSAFGAVGPLPRCRLTEFPDIAAITGQAGLHEAVFLWQDVASIESLVARTSIGSELANAIAVAAALTGLIEVLPAPAHPEPPPVERAKPKHSVLARLAHFLGLSHASERERW